MAFNAKRYSVEYHKAHYHTYRDQQQRKARKRARTLKGKFNSLTKGARYREIECTLTLEEYKNLVISASCFYCNGPLPEAGCGIDRIDSSKGYILGNVYPCCSRCNTAKASMTVTEFLSHVERIYENRVAVTDSGARSNSVDCFNRQGNVENGTIQPRISQDLLGNARELEE